MTVLLWPSLGVVAGCGTVPAAHGDANGGAAATHPLWSVLLPVAKAIPLGRLLDQSTHGSEPPTLEELRAAIDAWYSSLTTIDARYRVTSKVGAKTMRWAEDFLGHRQFYEMRRDGEKQRAAQHYDGTRSIHITYPDEGPPHGVVEPTPSPKTLSTASPAHLAGLDIWTFDGSLADAIAQAKTVTVDGTKELRGERHIVLVASGIEVVRTKAYQLRVIAYLDPTHDYLPGRIELFNDTEENHLSFEVTVERFSKVPDRESSRDRWFPVAGVVLAHFKQHNKSSRETIEVSQASVGVALPDELFRPVLPVGTLLQDKIRRENVVIGGEESRLAILAKSLAEKEPLQEVPLPSARPIIGMHWAMGWSAGFAIVLLSALMVMWVRRARS
jgi:hypothetical protein